MAREHLTWERDFQTVHSGSLVNGDNAWFLEGRLNASYNCVDRHAFKDPDRIAIIYEADEPNQGREISYGELLREVSKLAYTLTQMGVRKGDTVALYLPMVPEAVIAFLACTRIGALHSVVFAGFSSDSLRDRVLDAKSKVVITSDEGRRGGKVIGTKKIVDDALKQCPDVSHCLVFKRTGKEIPWTEGRDYWWHEELEKYPAYMAPESMSAEDPLFLLYTSGSTGKPKGLMHTTGGYLLGAAMTGKYVFDIHDGDKFFCGGDVGWITGHTYVVYAPLLLGVTTVVFEGTPAYPDFSRYWEVIEKYEISQFYVAPTALRLLKRAGDSYCKHPMKKLRVLGSVGEPIAAEVWKWYFEIVGKEEAHVIDVGGKGLSKKHLLIMVQTYWQTETGSHVITPLGGITPTKPGSASLPFFGIDPAIIDPVSGKEISGNDVEGVLAFKKPWPSMARTVWGAHKRYMDTYLNVYKGYYVGGKAKISSPVSSLSYAVHRRWCWSGPRRLLLDPWSCRRCCQRFRSSTVHGRNRSFVARTSPSRRSRRGWHCRRAKWPGGQRFCSFERRQRNHRPGEEGSDHAGQKEHRTVCRSKSYLHCGRLTKDKER